MQLTESPKNKAKRQAKSKNAKQKNLPGSTTNLGQSELDAPDLTLVAQTILADKLQFGVPV